MCAFELRTNPTFPVICLIVLWLSVFIHYASITPSGDVPKHGESGELNVTKTQTVVVANLTYVYQVVEKGTLNVISTHSTRVAASRKVDRLDNAYGCYHYFVRQQYKVQS